MTRRFSVGDHVTWNSEAGHVSGRIIKVHKKNLSYKGYIHHASNEDPQYEIKSDKTDHIAMHKGSALKKTNGWESIQVQALLPAAGDREKQRPKEHHEWATVASLRKALPKGRLPDFGRSTVAARFDQERAGVKLWLKDVAQARTCASGSVTTRQVEAVSGLLPERTGREEGLDLLNRRPKQTLTLVYGAGNEEHNEAVVLKRILEGHRMEDEF